MVKRAGIGLLGGTFDPIHLGHVHLARSVYHALNLEAIHFIPAAQPLLRDKPQANAAQRLEMVRLVTETEPFFEVDDREIQRGGDSYMIDTLADIHEACPDAPHCLIIGVDQFSKFDQWKDWQKIPELSHIIVTSRKGAELSLNMEINDFLLQHQTDKVDDIHQLICGKIFHLTLETLLVSSTMIREKIRNSDEVSDVLPEKVMDYIKDNALYQRLA